MFYPLQDALLYYPLLSPYSQGPYYYHGDVFVVVENIFSEPVYTGALTATVSESEC